MSMRSEPELEIRASKPPPFTKGDLGGFVHMLRYDGKLKQLAIVHRKNMTDAERHLWSKVRLKQLEGYQFYRQKVIGNYIVDFYCPRARLVIEVDGSQHYSDEMIRTDRTRDDYMKTCGLKVLRFNDIDVLTNVEGVVESILQSWGAEGENPS
jgi:very-short-patch-repair endonuclease